MPDFFPLDADDPEDETGLVTLEEVKTAEHISGNDNDAAINQLIPQVSSAIRRLTDRDFGIEEAESVRRFSYTGGGVCDIDDCTAITAVTMDGRSLSEGRDYSPERERSGGPYFYLTIYADRGRAETLEMNFTQNTGTYSGAHKRRIPSVVEVHGTFGWTPVPPDVKLAAIEMIRVVADLPQDDIQNEAIAEYSYSNVPDTFNSGRWPTRAVDLLRPYKRINL